MPAPFAFRLQGNAHAVGDLTAPVLVGLALLSYMGSSHSASMRPEYGAGIAIHSTALLRAAIFIPLGKIQIHFAHERVHVTLRLPGRVETGPH